MTHRKLDSVAELQAENARLIALLDAHGIKDRMYSRALVLPYDDETQSIDYRQIDGSSANDEKS